MFLIHTYYVSNHFQFSYFPAKAAAADKHDIRLAVIHSQSIYLPVEAAVGAGELVMVTSVASCDRLASSLLTVCPWGRGGPLLLADVE
jgi:hypothetical protein